MEELIGYRVTPYWIYCFYITNVIFNISLITIGLFIYEEINDIGKGAQNLNLSQMVRDFSDLKTCLIKDHLC